MQEVPMKPKRNKKLDVPVHKQLDTHRIFSANFDGKRGDYEAEKPSRKQLTRENERLQTEKNQLELTQEQLIKKNSKLKEKIGIFLNANEELTNENQILKTQYDELCTQYNNFVMEMEKEKSCTNCAELSEQLESTKKDYYALKNLNHEIQDDCKMLKNVIYRLNVQLERYQDKLNAGNLNSNPIRKEDFSGNVLGLGESHFDHTHTPVNWGKVHQNTLAPLLNAYQEILEEKEVLIEDYQVEIGKFTGKLKEIVKENEMLHFKLTEDSECSKVLSVQINGVKDELKAVKEQNDLLIKKCSLKQDKVEEILKCYEQKVELLKRDYAVLHEQYLKNKTEVATLKEKNKSLLDFQEEFKNERNQYIPIAVHNSSVNECKKWYEELKNRYELEKIKLNEINESLKIEIADLNRKIVQMNDEKVDLENKLKNYDKIIKKSETKCLELEHNLHEVQLSRSACRKQLHKAMNFAKDLVTEQESLLKALSHRQQENKAVKRIGSDIVSRMDVLRNQLKTVQKEAWQELTTVEERIQEQDSLISSMKEEHEQEVERLKNIIKVKESASSIKIDEDKFVNS